MDRDDVEQRLLHRHPDLAPGVVVAAVARAARRAGRRLRGPHMTSWLQVEQAAEEQLLLRQSGAWVRSDTPV